MKCNKCLKIIPNGEEIKIYGGGHYIYEHYGGNYCEECWKNKKEYRDFENGGELNKNNKNNNEMSSGEIFALILTIFAIVGWLIWIWNKKNKEKNTN